MERTSLRSKAVRKGAEGAAEDDDEGRWEDEARRVAAFDHEGARRRPDSGPGIQRTVARFIKLLSSAENASGIRKEDQSTLVQSTFSPILAASDSTDASLWCSIPAVETPIFSPFFRYFSGAVVGGAQDLFVAPLGVDGL